MMRCFSLMFFYNVTCKIMIKSHYWVITFLVLIVYIVSFRQLSAVETAQITKWEYCEGCKETVNLFSLVCSAELNKMQKQGKVTSSVLAVQDLVVGICDNAHLNSFNNFIKLSCIKIMEEYQLPFLKQFEGSVSSVSTTHTSLIFDRKRKICVDEVQACSPYAFNTTYTDRSKCSACNIVANDIETLRKVINKKTVNFRDMLESDSFCGGLGSTHAPPYAWLESMCEEMIDDKIDAILDIFKFHDKIARTGLTPSETAAEMMCKEFYHCGEDASRSSSTNVNKAAKAKTKSTKSEKKVKSVKNDASENEL